MFSLAFVFFVVCEWVVRLLWLLLAGEGKVLMREEKDGGKLFFLVAPFPRQVSTPLVSFEIFFLLPRTSQRGKFCVRCLQCT